MSVTVTGISETQIALIRTADRLHREHLVYLRRMSHKIQERAREYAPVDQGDLEGAIVVEEEKSDAGRRRIVIFVGVDPELLGEGYTEAGFRYDEYNHEFMDSPDGAGLVRPGPKTRAKGPQAGGKFLERAFQDFEDEIISEMERITRSAKL